MADEQNEGGLPKRYETPPLRQFTITRRFPMSENRPDQEIVVAAHIIQHAGQNADTLMFFDYVVDPVVGPTTRLHRIVRGDTDVVETTPPVSQIIQ